MSSDAGVVIDAVGVISDTRLGDNTVKGSIVPLPPFCENLDDSPPPGNTLYVPGQFSPIQDAISSANDGDSIILEPGLYNENIDFLGKEIALKGSNPKDSMIVESTAIDASFGSPSVIFARGENRDASIEGVTVKNSFGDKAIQISNASPTIKGNVIKDSGAGGIAYCNSKPLITNNKIFNTGINSGITLDKDGVIRPQMEGFDIGAYESLNQ